MDVKEKITGTEIDRVLEKISGKMLDGTADSNDVARFQELVEVRTSMVVRILDLPQSVFRGRILRQAG